MKSAGKNPVMALVVCIAAIVFAVGLANMVLNLIAREWPVIMIIILIIVVGFLTPRIIRWIKANGEFKPHA